MPNAVLNWLFWAAVVVVILGFAYWGLFHGIADDAGIADGARGDWEDPSSDY